MNVDGKTGRLASGTSGLSPMPFIFLALFGIALNWLLFAWPLLNISSLYTAVQDPDFSDQNFYLYYARELCGSRDLSIEDYYVTWSSTGVMYYLTGLCKVTGSELLYGIVNPCLFAGSMFLLAREVCDRFNISKIQSIYLFSFPHTVYLMALPGKEILSWLGACMVIYALLLFSRTKPSYLAASLAAFVGLIVLIVNRPHELVIVGAAMLLLFPLKNRFIPIIAGSVMAAAMLALSTGASDTFSLLLDQASGRENVGVADQYGGALSSLELMLSSDNEFVHAILSPVRALFLALSPFSILFRSIQFGEINYFIFREVPAAIKLLDMISTIVVIVLFVRDRGKGSDTKLVRRAFVGTWILSLLVITYPGLQQKSRYLFQYLPLVMLVGATARRDRAVPRLESAHHLEIKG